MRESDYESDISVYELIEMDNYNRIEAIIEEERNGVIDSMQEIGDK